MTSLPYLFGRCLLPCSDWNSLLGTSTGELQLDNKCSSSPLCLSLIYYNQNISPCHNSIVTCMLIPLADFLKKMFVNHNLFFSNLLCNSQELIWEEAYAKKEINNLGKGLCQVYFHTETIKIRNNCTAVFSRLF